MEPMDAILSLERHCFFVGPLSMGGEKGLPASLPFRLGVHPEFAIPMLLVDDVTSAALDKAYAQGSMASTPLGESPLATSRMNETIEGLLATLHKDIKNCSLLEIGAGAGGLMNAIRLMGAQVTGIEIGPQGQIAAEQLGLRIVPKLFVPDLFDEKFDIVYSYGCVEHLPDLKAFFSASRSCLREGGLMFHVVPNSELFFERGGLDHLAHEHINYFSAENGIRLFEAQGFSRAGARFNKAKNELMLWGFYDSAIKPHWPTDAVAYESEKLVKYAKKLYQRIEDITATLNNLLSSGESVGFYAGGFEYGCRLDNKSIRYFDGDAFKQGKCWLVGFPPIESPESLINRPVDHLIIFKPYLFNDIIEKLKSLGQSRTRIWNIACLGDDGK